MNTSKMSSMTSLLFDDVILLSLAIDGNDIYEGKKVPTKATAPRILLRAQSVEAPATPSEAPYSFSEKPISL